MRQKWEEWSNGLEVAQCQQIAKQSPWKFDASTNEHSPESHQYSERWWVETSFWTLKIHFVTSDRIGINGHFRDWNLCQSRKFIHHKSIGMRLPLTRCLIDGMKSIRQHRKKLLQGLDASLTLSLSRAHTLSPSLENSRAICSSSDHAQTIEEIDIRDWYWVLDVRDSIVLNGVVGERYSWMIGMVRVCH